MMKWYICDPHLKVETHRFLALNVLWISSFCGNGRYWMNYNGKTHHWITAHNHYRLGLGYLPLAHTPWIMSISPVDVIRVWCSCWRSSGPRQWARGQPRPRPARRTSWGVSCRGRSGRLRTGSDSPWYKALQEK